MSGGFEGWGTTPAPCGKPFMSGECGCFLEEKPRFACSRQTDEGEDAIRKRTRKITCRAVEIQVSKR